jgi:hypothetical protein
MNQERPDNKSAADQFNELLKEIHHRSVIGDSYVGNSHVSDDQKLAFDRWLGLQSSKDAIDRAFKPGEIKEFIIILNSEKVEDYYFVHYLNDIGSHPCMVYSQKNYPMGPEELNPGDIILLTTQNMIGKSILKVDLAPEDHRAVMKKIFSAYGYELE